MRAIPTSAQFIDTYFPNIDGVVRTVHNYAEQLNKRSYSCVVAPEQEKNYKDSFDYDVYRVKSLRLPSYEYRLPITPVALDVSAALTRIKPNIIHAHSPFTMGRYALLTARRLDVPIVTTFHSKYYDDVLKITRSELIAKEAVALIVDYYNRVDQVWTCGTGTAQTLYEYGYRGDIFVIDNGTDYKKPDNPDLLATASSKLFSIPDGKPVLLFVGHQIWQKNLKLVLDSAKLLREKGFDFMLVIVGDGYAASEIKEYANSVGLGDDTVRFTGSIVDREVIQGLYLRSDLFYFPSVYDNSPLVVREAASMGLPSLLVSGSNAADVVTDGVNGFLAPNDEKLMAQKIEKIFSDREALKLVGEGATKICKSWDEIIEGVIARYRSIV